MCGVIQIYSETARLHKEIATFRFVNMFKHTLIMYFITFSSLKAYC